MSDPVQRPHSPVPPQDVAATRWLIFLYLLLWVVEGALRKWVLPGLATPLLLVRDPLVIAIYFLAFQRGRFPINGFVTSALAISVLGSLIAVAVGHGDIFVAAYGFRTFFLHLPLLWIMRSYLTRDDLYQIGRWGLALSVPMTLLLIAQYKSPESAWVNRGIGGEGTAVFDGALGKNRPPGTFSFITGPAALYPLLTAFWFALFLARKAPVWLLLISGVAIFLACPVSISRGLVVGVALVAGFGILACLRVSSMSPERFIGAVVGLVAVVGLAQLHPEFRVASEAFMSRWDASTTDHGGVDEAIVGRIVGDVFGPVQRAFDYPLLGYGIGLGTQVGAKIQTGEKGFALGESEFDRVLAELGPILGLGMMGLRIGLVFVLGTGSFSALRSGNFLPILFFATAAPSILVGQWGQSTSLGAFAITGGLTLLAFKRPKSLPRPALAGSRADPAVTAAPSVRSA